MYVLLLSNLRLSVFDAPPLPSFPPPSPRRVCIKRDHGCDFHGQASGLRGQFQLHPEGGG